MKVQKTVTIHRPIEEVFRYITNHNNEPLWNPDVKSVQDYSPDGWTLGSTCTMLYQTTNSHDSETPSPAQLGKLLVTAFRPNEEYAFRSEASNYVVESKYLLASQHEATLLMFSSSVHMRGILLRTVMRIPVRRSIERTLRRNFDNLKAILETQRIPEESLA